MRTLKYWLSWDRAPSLERIPLAILRATVSGLITGIPVGLMLLLIFSHEHLDSLGHPMYWVLMPAIGAIFSVSFYLTCGLPQGYLTQLACAWPQGRLRLVRGLLGAVGGMAGLVLAANTLRLVLPFRIINLDRMNQWMIIDAIIGAVLALVIGAWIQKDMTEKNLLAAAARSQAQALQAQIQPHFFFNTMNTVQSLIDTDAPQAKRVIGRLSGMFRYTLAAGQNGMVPITDELTFVRDYLEIEKARFGDRLQYQLPVGTALFQIPALLIQPLVENAVRHGIAKRIEGGEVIVEIELRAGAHEIRVGNPVERMPELALESVFQAGHALENIRGRLQLMYGGRASLVLRQRGEYQVEAIVRIPCES